MVVQEVNLTSGFRKRFNSLIRVKIRMGQWLIQKLQISKKELEPPPTFLTKLGDFLLKPFVNKQLIPQILMGPFSFQVFRVSHELGIFEYLNKHPGATLADICNHINLDPYPTKILLLGLTGLKLIKKVEENYYTSAATRIITQDQSNKFTQFFPKYLDYAQHILLAGIHHLQDAAIKNKPVGLHKIFGEEAHDYYFELSKNPRANELFFQHMSAFSQINAEKLASLELFSKVTTLLDVGGGSGDVAISIASRHPNITITVYDHPNVAEMAQQKFTQSRFVSRLTAIGGNIAKEPFPTNFQGVLFSHFIDIFSPEENKQFFKRAFDTLNTSGCIVVYTPVIQDDEKGPLVNCLLGVYFLCLANGKGRFYSAAQIKSWLSEAGFVDIKVQALPSAEAIITGVKP